MLRLHASPCTVAHVINHSAKPKSVGQITACKRTLDKERKYMLEHFDKMR
jgi:hypothetical protein